MGRAQLRGEIHELRQETFLDPEDFYLALQEGDS